MNWKEFLKPDRRKVVLTIILAISHFLFLYFFMLGGSLAPDWSECCELIREDKLPFSCEDYPYSNRCCQFTEESCTELEIGAARQSLIIWMLLYGPFIWCYPISCIVVWLYDKRKKKS